MSAEREGRRAAEKFREDHGLGLAPIDDLFMLVERVCGVDVAVVEHGSDAHGMTMRHGHTVVIGVARTPHPMRQRSSLAHEVAHVVFGDIDRPLVDGGWSERSPGEVRADVFARHLLLPVQAVRDRVGAGPVGLGDLSGLVQGFGVSPAMTAIQMRHAHAIGEDICADWMRESSRALSVRFGWQAAYDAMASVSDTIRAPQELLARATRAYEAGVLSLALLARLQGRRDVTRVREELEEAGVVPRSDDEHAKVSRPQASPESLSAAELDEFLAGLDD